MVIAKVETDMIDNIAAGPIGRTGILVLVIMIVETYKMGVEQVSQLTNLFETASQVKFEANLKETFDAPYITCIEISIYTLPT